MTLADGERPRDLVPGPLPLAQQPMSDQLTFRMPGKVFLAPVTRSTTDTDR